MALAFKLQAYSVAALLRLLIKEDKAFSFMSVASALAIEEVSTVISLVDTEPQPEPRMVNVSLFCVYRAVPEFAFQVFVLIAQMSLLSILGIDAEVLE